MTVHRLVFALLSLAMLAVEPVYAAELKLASPFAGHMVLQRDREIHIWGQGQPAGKVEVDLAGQKAQGVANADGRWDLTLKPMPAGGPHRLAVSSGDKNVVLEDVLIGDVWLCSGQSNMQMPLKECDDAPAVAKSAEAYKTLRICTVGKGWKATPETSADIKWRTPSPETALNFSAVGYYFAIELLKDPKLSNVPIGVIDSSFGGTTCEGWIPNQALTQFDAKDLHDSMFGIKPGMLYNAMIAPLGHLGLKGAVWYQGEGNANQPRTYAKFLTTMIGEWRKQFESPQLPFLIVQLPDFAEQSSGLQWSWLREAQAKAVAATPHAALALAIGTNDGFNLHPKQKHEIGRRLALLARRDAYQEKLIASGPIFKQATIEGSTIRVSFDTGGDGLASADGPVRGFAVAGEDGQYRFAHASIDGENVIVKCNDIAAPKTVRYAWAGVPDASLTNKTGLPAAPFRTDKLAPGGIEIQKQPAIRHLTASGYEIAISGNGDLTSLGVGGKQFLSNALGGAGGTSIPGFLGARSLANIRELGPDVLSCSDDQVTLLLSFKSDSMDWVISNRGKDPIDFKIALSPQVAVLEAKDDQPLRLTRGKAVLRIRGIEEVSSSDEGKVLKIKVKGGAQKRIELQTGPG